MPAIPLEAMPDSTVALALDPYRFISRTCRRHGTDLFQTRIMLRKTICMTGPAAAELFCDNDRFVRRGATPERIRQTLVGRGGVQGLDGEEHRHRKQMFMYLMPPDRVRHLGELFAGRWLARAGEWASMDRVVLYDELQEILTRTVCDWAGVPLAEPEVDRRTKDLTAMFDAAGAVGPRHWRSRRARNRGERWAAGLVEQVRAGQIKPPEQSALHVIAAHRDQRGHLLDPRIAAVELLNVLRPTVAVSVFIVFVAHALHEHPVCRQKLQSGDANDYAQWFVQEVRRFYPFFPSVLARVRRDFEWKGFRFPAGATVMLDLYGTDHDPRAWDAPDEFRPERFAQRDPGPFDFIPQGPGDHKVNHRCPGEPIAVELMKVAAEFLTKEMKYDVPSDQDLRIDFDRLPALPRSRFVIRNVRVDADKEEGKAESGDNSRGAP